MEGRQAVSIASPAPAADRIMVVFRLLREEFAAPIAHVSEILRPRRLWRMPKAPHYVLGLMNHRGRVLPVVDPKLRLQLVPSPEDKLTRVMVLEFQGDQMGLLVDEVKEVFRTPADTFREAPELVQESTREYLSGVVSNGDRMILMLDLERLFTLDLGGAF